MTAKERGHEIVVWYYFPQEGPHASIPKTATTTQMRSGEALRPINDGLAALARPSITPPAPPSPAVVRPSDGQNGQGRNGHDLRLTRDRNRPIGERAERL
ncbi:hypothetical protein AB0L00_31775 [Actinoallomurus sp. NPDC052308]|uniref:hypothetical protein n=1 Tax=Actinoallomurus sp. NPDC052308 TaxID=3155530 RepID=UPI003441CA5D